MRTFLTGRHLLGDALGICTAFLLAEGVAPWRVFDKGGLLGFLQHCETAGAVSGEGEQGDDLGPIGGDCAESE